MTACKFIPKCISYTEVYPWELVAERLKASSHVRRRLWVWLPLPPPPVYSLIFFGQGIAMRELIYVVQVQLYHHSGLEHCSVFLKNYSVQRTCSHIPIPYMRLEGTPLTLFYTHKNGSIFINILRCQWWVFEANYSGCTIYQWNGNTSGFYLKMTYHKLC